MHFLVAGGAGFLGSHIAEKLCDEGHQVTVVDNLSSGQEYNLRFLKGREGFRFFKCDIVNTLPVFEKLDGIFNLACPASPIFYQSIPIETTLSSVVGVYNLLRLADEHNCRILQTSTSEVYGCPEITPQSESYRGRVNCYGPRACYDEGKRAAEALFYDFNKQHGTDIRIIRIFNTYGPNMHMDDGRVVSNFIVQALRGEPLTVYGDGQQRRSFCYVDDMVNAIFAIWNSDIQKPVNAGNPDEWSMLRLAHDIRDRIGSKSEILHLPMPQDDPLQRCPDISLIKSLNWLPKVSLDKGLELTIPYFRGLISRHSRGVNI